MPLLLAGNLKAELQSAIINTYQPDFLYHSTTPESSAPQFTLTARANSPTVLHPDLALLLSTSGSTGSPKVVRLSASNLQSNATAIAHYLELNQNERPITSLPINYSYGLSVLNSHLRLQLNSWAQLERSSHQGHGLFYELSAPNLNEVLAHCSEHEQTICSLGLSAAQWQEAIAATPPRGLCRIVAWGRALECNRIWDGYDLIATMSRALTLEL